MKRCCLLIALFPCLASCVFLPHESPEADIPNVRVLDLVGGVQLKWDAISGAEKYGVWRRIPGKEEKWEKLGETSTLGFVDGNARGGIPEAYAVCAIMRNTVSGFETVYGTAQQGVGIPNVWSTSLPGAVKLTWERIDGAESYGIWRRHSVDPHWINLGSTTALFFIDRQATEKETEFYTVRTRKGEKYSEIFVVSGMADEKLDNPKPAASGGAGGVKLSWRAIPRAEHYVILRQDTKTESWVEIGSTTSLQYFDEHAELGREEAYAVCACQKEIVSEFTTVRGIALLGVPRLSATSVNGGVKLTWNSVPGAEYYEVWRTFSAHEQWINVGSTTQVQFTDKTLEPETAETYAVRAVRQDEASPLVFVEGVARKGNDAPELTAISRPGFIELKWTDVLNADQYSIWKRNEENTDWVLVVETKSFQAFDDNARFGVAETYIVRAHQGAAFSESAAIRGTAFE